MSRTNPFSPPVVLGLGSNLGDRVGTLKNAVRQLEELLGVEFVASSLFQSAPIGPAQPDFLNAALLCRTELPLEIILQHAQRVEAEHGRVRADRWGPRTLDIDLLWAGVSTNVPLLQVPHRELGRRAFAMEPLLELWNQLSDRHLYPLRAEWFTHGALQERSQQRLELIRDSSWASVRQPEDDCPTLF